MDLPAFISVFAAICREFGTTTLARDKRCSVDPQAFTGRPRFGEGARAARKRIGRADPNWPAWYAEYMEREQSGEELPF
jgi:hypothetical protein